MKDAFCTCGVKHERERERDIEVIQDSENVGQKLNIQVEFNVRRYVICWDIFFGRKFACT